MPRPVDPSKSDSRTGSRPPSADNRTVNGSEEGGPDILELYLRAGDRVVIASDGLTDLVDEAVIAETLAHRPDDDAVSALVATHLAGVGGMLSWLALERWRTGSATTLGGASGALHPLGQLDPDLVPDPAPLGRREGVHL